MQTQQLNTYKNNNQLDKFFEHLNENLPNLKRFIKQKLHIAEKNGIIPKGFYAPEDIIDEVYQIIYEEFDPNWTENQIKTKIFQLAIDKLNQILKQESQKPEKIDIDTLIEQETRFLDEKITIDADGEFVLVDELDDISYQQAKAQPQYLILERPIEEKLLELYDKDSKEQLTKTQENNFWKLYKYTPAQSKLVIELLVFAGLSTDEITDITEIPQNNVKKIITTFKNKLRKS